MIDEVKRQAHGKEIEITVDINKENFDNARRELLRAQQQGMTKMMMMVIMIMYMSFSSGISQSSEMSDPVMQFLEVDSFIVSILINEQFLRECHVV